MAKRRYDLTKVPQGTYAKIARATGYSAEAVRLVAKGERNNARIEELLLVYYLEHKRAEARRQRLLRLIKNHRS